MSFMIKDYMDKLYKVSYANEDHPIEIPFHWDEFKPTTILDEEVYGWYAQGWMVAVQRKDYDRYLLENIPSIDTNKKNK